MVCGLRDGQVLAEVPGDWQRECVTASNREHLATTVQERVRCGLQACRSADPGGVSGAWRLMSIDGFEWDVPDTPANVAAFGHPGGGKDRAAFPKARVVTIGECGSRAVADAEIGGVAGKGSGEQSLARRLYGRLDPTGC